MYSRKYKATSELLKYVFKIWEDVSNMEMFSLTEIKRTQHGG